MLALARSCGWLVLVIANCGASLAAEPVDDGKLRIICFGAHPDDCELRAAGVAAKWAAAGHHVKFVSTTNGDIGHWQIYGPELAARRLAEVRAAAKILGIETEVLDIHDGELEPTLENRKTVVRLIRQWRADVVCTSRPNDYHPDHRNTGLLLQDAAFMVTVPFFCPETPYLEKNPVFLYYTDRFQKPNPFQADVVVAIDDVWDKKIAALDQLPSQMYEGGAIGNEAFVRQVPTDPAARREWLAERMGRRDGGETVERLRPQLASWYGPERAAEIRYVEAFEICEYGSQPSRDELKRLFPFFEP